mmetsp:Transcript_24158/g.75853  ORF Transcript_24158/g.75853 Transcript_24158/m.75853 type:complete len:300 (+) Transcript_24158:232-1131(+)
MSPSGPRRRGCRRTRPATSAGSPRAPGGRHCTSPALAAPQPARSGQRPWPSVTAVRKSVPWAADGAAMGMPAAGTWPAGTAIGGLRWAAPLACQRRSSASTGSVVPATRWQGPRPQPMPSATCRRRQQPRPRELLATRHQSALHRPLPLRVQGQVQVLAAAAAPRQPPRPVAVRCRAAASAAGLAAHAPGGTRGIPPSLRPAAAPRPHPRSRAPGRAEQARAAARQLQRGRRQRGRRHQGWALGRRRWRGLSRHRSRQCHSRGPEPLGQPGSVPVWASAGGCIHRCLQRCSEAACPWSS